LCLIFFFLIGLLNEVSFFPHHKKKVPIIFCYEVQHYKRITIGITITVYVGNCCCDCSLFLFYYCASHNVIFYKAFTTFYQKLCIYFHKTQYMKTLQLFRYKCSTLHSKRLKINTHYICILYTVEVIDRHWWIYEGRAKM